MLDPRADIKPVGTFYFPFDQSPRRGLTLVARTRGEPGAIFGDIRRIVRGVDPQLPLFKVQPMQTWIDDALTDRRLPMLIASAFGLVAMLLAALGIYGVLAYSVSERRRELGVRMALGGSGASVFGLVLRDGLRIVGIGVVAGLSGAAALGRVMTSELFGVAPLDPTVVAGVTVLLTIVALVASGIPAIRASRINPVVVLGK